MFVDIQPRRSLDSFPGLPPIPCPPDSNSHGIISFAVPHPLNSFVSYRYKNRGGQGTASLLSLPTIDLTPLAATLMGLTTSVANKRLTETYVETKPLKCNTYKKTRGGTPRRFDSLTFRRWKRVFQSLPSQPSPVLSFGRSSELITHD